MLVCQKKVIYSYDICIRRRIIIHTFRTPNSFARLKQLSGIYQSSVLSVGCVVVCYCVRLYFLFVFMYFIYLMVLTKSEPKQGIEGGKHLDMY